MSLYLNTRGKSRIAIAICGRCSLKMAYVDLAPDPNIPGLRVCKDCRDIYDPWRLPARQTEDISLPDPRPDVPLTS